MTLSTNQSCDVATLAAVIAHSQIVVPARPLLSGRRLPAGFDDTDIAILNWIAAAGRRADRALVRM